MAPSTVSYEAFAPRSAEQIQRLRRLQALTAGPVEDQQQQQKQPQESSWTLADAMTVTSSETTTTSVPSSSDTTMSRTYQMCDQVTTVLKHSTSLRLALRASINICDDISNRHAELLRHSGELSASADRLQAEEAQLTQHAKEIGLPLQHYDAVDRIGVLVGVLFRGTRVVRGLAKVKVDHDEYPELLLEIDEAVDFFGYECGGPVALDEALKTARRKPGGANNNSMLLSGSMEYYRRSLALQEAALFLIQEAVVDRIAQTSNDISQSLHLDKHQVVAADKLEASLIYTRFHGISARSNRLIRLLTGHDKNTKGQKQYHADHSDAYHTLLTLCRTTYCTHREKLLKMTVRAHMDKLKDQHGLVGMTRIASVFLIRLCSIETQLYLDFFGEQATVTHTSNDDDTVDEPVITVTVDESNASIVNHVEFQTYLNNLCGGLHRTIRRGLVTVHDLDTLCQIVSVLREERGQASSSPITMAAARSISSVIEDAQERLIFCANSSLQKEVIRFRASPEDLDYPAKLLKQQSTVDDPVQRQLQIYESWFPPMRSVLKILSKIFRVVEPRVFEDIARESVQGCARSLKEGSLVILQRSKSQMHADLFLVKHLLILREQLSPFDMDLRSVERQLDFSDAGKAVSRFLANRNRRLFSMSTENALVTLLREGVSVQVQNVDSKRDLEDALRSACNDFIDHTSTSLLAMPPSATSTREIMLTILQKAQNELPQQLESVITQMGLYLENAATQSILLKPVSKKLYRVMEDMKKEISKNNNDDNSEVLNILSNLETIIKTTISSSSNNTKSSSSTTEAAVAAETTTTNNTDQQEETK